MPFQPNVKDVLVIGGVRYAVDGHPLMANMPYGQEGRQGTVYRLLQLDTHTLWALKVFRPSFRYPALVQQAEVLAAYAALSGLQVCERTVLTPQHHFELISKHPELLYAVLMPWIDGPTWMDVLLDEQVPEQQVLIETAEALAALLSQMEQNGIAHGDLSATNVIIPRLLGADYSSIALVDVEQMYAPGLNRPNAMPAGSPGYARTKGSTAEWNPAMDRYAGGMLITEMLVWTDSRIRASAWGESFLDPQQMGHDKDRINLLLQVLSELYNDSISYLFQRVWTSVDNTQCPTFGEWEVALRQYRLHGHVPVAVQETSAPPRSEERQDALQQVTTAPEAAVDEWVSNREQVHLHDSKPEADESATVHVDEPFPNADEQPPQEQHEQSEDVNTQDRNTIDSMHRSEPETVERPMPRQPNPSALPSAAEIIVLAERQEQEGRWADAIRSYEQLLLYYSPSSDIGYEAEQARLAALDSLMKLKEQEEQRKQQERIKRRRRNRIAAVVASTVLLVGGAGGLWVWSPWEARSEASTDSKVNIAKQPDMNQKDPVSIKKPEPSDSEGQSSGPDVDHDKTSGVSKPETETVPEPDQDKVTKPETESEQASPSQPQTDSGQQQESPSKPTSTKPTIPSKPTPEKTTTPPKKSPAAQTNPPASSTTEIPVKTEDSKASKIKALEEDILYAFNVDNDTNEVIRLCRELLKLDANNAIASKMLKDLTG